MNDLPHPLPEIAAYLARQGRVAKVAVPRLRDLTPDMQAVVEELRTLTSHWNPVEIYTADPDSIQEEHERFLAAYLQHEVYQPTFRYSYAQNFTLNGAKERLQSLLKQVRVMQPIDRTLQIAKLGLWFKIKDDLSTVDLIEGLQKKDDAQIARGLQFKYPGTDPVVLKLAKEDLAALVRNEQEEILPARLTADEQRKLRTMTCGCEEFKEAFEWALSTYGILRSPENPTGFRVVIDERATAMDVRDKSTQGPTVFIPRSTRSTAEHLLSLMVHEIEGHARQSANGEKLFLFGGGALKIDDETLYEGLAMRHEYEFRREWFGTEESSPFPDFYTLAIAHAEAGGSFYDIFDTLVSKILHMLLHIDLQRELPDPSAIDPVLYDDALRMAWRTTYRVMRGHIDMRNTHRYAMAKDLAYLRGWLLDRQLKQSGHGHMNEASIASLGMLRILAEFTLHEEDLPHPYQGVTVTYMQELLNGERKFQ